MVVIRQNSILRISGYEPVFVPRSSRAGYVEQAGGVNRTERMTRESMSTKASNRPSHHRLLEQCFLQPRHDGVRRRLPAAYDEGSALLLILLPE